MHLRYRLGKTLRIEARMIPPEAVDAVVDLSRGRGVWVSRWYARALLEAAAPYIVASAFRGAADQLEYGNPINEWLHELADALEEKNAE
jgi:hypothetical protein